MGSYAATTTNTVTENVDKRFAFDKGVGFTADNSTVTVNSVDADIVKAALDTIGTADAVNGDGFARLLNAAEKIFSGGGSILEKTAETTQANIAALQTSQADASGVLDQKTLMIIGGVLVVALFVWRKKGA